MKIENVPVECITITEVASLDRIHVFWINLEPGQGYIIVMCYGCAWSAYFGGMAGDTIQQFVARVEVDYLATKLTPTSQRRYTKAETAYLTRIAAVVIDAARAELQRTA
jgi:hypothetical protein